MNYEEYLVNEFSNKYPDAEISIQDVTKANGDYRGLIIRRPGENVAPTINIDAVAKEMEEGDRDFDWAVETIDQIFQTSDIDKPIIPEFNKEFVLANVNYRLLNKDRNMEIFDTSPCVEFNDLILVPYVDIESSSDMISSARVTYDNLKAFGATEDELKAAATKNMMPVVKTLGEVIREMMSNDGMDENMIDDIVGGEKNAKMYICSNKGKSYGAGCVLFDNVMEKLSEKLDDNLYLLPSSVHETLIIPASTMSYDEALHMVTEVNRETVSEKDFLSDNVYVYDKELKAFKTQNVNQEI